MKLGSASKKEGVMVKKAAVTRGGGGGGYPYRRVVALLGVTALLISATLLLISILHHHYHHHSESLFSPLRDAAKDNNSSMNSNGEEQHTTNTNYDDNYVDYEADGEVVVVRDNEGVIHRGTRIGPHPHHNHRKKRRAAGGKLPLLPPPPAIDHHLRCNTSIYTKGRGWVFLNVRYAIPFRDEKWASMGKSLLETDVQTAEDNNRWGAVCPQFGRNTSNQQQFFGSPNCLSLNIFAPLPVAGQPSSAADGDGHPQRYPVLFFVHGGAFMRGSAAELGACGIVENLVHRHRIVVVTVQYRLGLWGWLNLNEETNFTEKWGSSRGLWDMMNALNWVQRNIDVFGGDPRRVTLAGHEAGGCMVGWLASLAMQPGMSKLKLHKGREIDIIDSFNNVIMQSGSTLYCMATGLSRMDPTEKFGHALCNGPLTELCAVKHIQTTEMMTPSKLVSVENAILEIPMMQLAHGFGAVPGYSHIRIAPTHPTLGLKKLNFLMGSTKHEWTYFDSEVPARLKQDGYSLSGGKINVDWLRAILHLAAGEWSIDIIRNSNAWKNNSYTEAVKQTIRMYTGFDTGNRLHWYRIYVQFMTDLVFNAPMFVDADYFAKHGHRVYFYKFAHLVPDELQQANHSDIIRTMAGHRYTCTPHKADLNYLFMPADKWVKLKERSHLLPKQPQHTTYAQELKMAEVTADTWAHFIKHGQPSLPIFFDRTTDWSTAAFVELANGSATLQRPNSSSPWTDRLVASESLVKDWEQWRWVNIYKEPRKYWNKAMESPTIRKDE